MVTRKYLPLIYIVLLCAATMTGMITPKTNASQAEEVQVIPNEAIRLRILANSNQESDQKLKRAIRDEVNKGINKWVAELTSIEEARKVIKSHLPDIEAIAEEVMVRENNVQKMKVDFGKTVFPTKLYGQYLYPAGEYEAIKITLGEGEGENWWCVLFPPLCFLDFNSGTAVASESNYDDSSTVSEQSSEEEDLETEIEIDEQEVEVLETASQSQMATSQAVAEETKYDDTVEKMEVASEQDTPPVYEDRDEEPVKVEFFLVELLKDLF